MHETVKTTSYEAEKKRWIDSLREQEEKRRADTAAKIGRTFIGGAYRDANSDKFDYSGFISPLALEMFAAYMHKNRLQSNGVMRDSDNWKAGMPLSVWKESLIRHTMHFWREWDSRPWTTRPMAPEDYRAMAEDLCGMLFNIQGLLLALHKQGVRINPVSPYVEHSKSSVGITPDRALRTTAANPAITSKVDTFYPEALGQEAKAGDANRAGACRSWRDAG